MAKLLLSAFFIGACLVPGLSSSYPQDTSQAQGSYLIGDPAKFHETDAVAGHIITYKINPVYPTEVINSRRKRQSIHIKQDENDKSALLKTIPATKKPGLNSKETNNTTVTSLSKPTQTDSNKTSPIPDNNNSSSNKSIVVDVVPVPPVSTSSKPIKNVPKDKSTNITSGDGSIIVNKTFVPSTSVPVDTDDANLTYPHSDEFNEDLKNSTNITRVDDHHRYYNSSYFENGTFLWINLDEHASTVDHELLSDAHRRAATLKLSFNFPFYGHIVNNVTVATGGFLYLGEQVHAWLAATQYVAPLMANFDSRFMNASVRYLSNENHFTVEWHEVRLQDASDRGPFTFQTTLHKNGSIVFAFKNIPVPIQDINDTQHPVKVGLSDAYISDRTILFVKQKTIYEYHRIDLSPYNITNGSAIIFTSLPTCLSYNNCQECAGREIDFTCEWCPATNRCSDGTDRHRQEWISKNCKLTSLKTKLECFITPATPSPDVYHNIVGQDDHDIKHLNLPDAQEKRQGQIQADSNPVKVSTSEESHGMTAASVIGILFLIAVLLGGSGWVVYAYHYPHSPSGQILIRFRPSQWRSFRRGEARYTAASIHM